MSGFSTLILGEEGPGTFGSSGTSAFLHFTGMYPNGATAANESEFQFRVPVSGKLKNLFISFISNAHTTTSTLRSRINGAFGNLNASIAGSALTASDTTHVDTINAGDLVCFQLTAGAGNSGAMLVGAFTAEFVADSGTVSFWRWQAHKGGVSSDANVHIFPVAGGVRSFAFTGNTTSTYKSTRCDIQAPATISNLRVYVATNTLVGATPPVTLYVNGVATALSITITGTGFFMDNTHSVHVNAGDYVEWRIDLTGRTSGGVGLGQVEATVTGDTTAFDLFGSASELVSQYATAFGTFWFTWGERILLPSTTPVEPPVKCVVPFNCTMSRLRGVATGSGTSQPLSVYSSRVNGANGTLSISIPAGSSGNLIRDNTHVDTIHAGDSIDLQGVISSTIVGGGGTIAWNPNIFGVTFNAGGSSGGGVARSFGAIF